MDHAIGGMPATTNETRRRERPGWWWTIGSVLLAWLMTTAGLLLALIPLSLLKADLSLFTLRGWAWAPDGAWATAAGIGPAFLTAVLFALSLRFAVEWRSDFKLLLLPAMLPVLGVLVLATEGAPYESGGAGAFLLTLVIVRQLAIVPDRNPWRPHRWQIAAIAVATLALTAATLAYRPFHPLHVQLGDEERGSGVSYLLGHDANPRVLAFGFDNASFADARIVTAAPIADGAPVVVRFPNPEPHALHEGWLSLPAGGMNLAPGTSDSAVIRLVPGLCRDGRGHPAEVRGLEVQVETLGMLRTQRFVRDAPVTLHCPAHRR